MQFDHVELYVGDREKAVRWYGHVLEFLPEPRLADWARRGPLMIANQAGQMLALFKGPAQGHHPERGFRRVAFRVDADGFVRFLQRATKYEPTLPEQMELRDHSLAISVYFADPFGNQLEVTTYDHESARESIHRFWPDKAFT